MRPDEIVARNIRETRKSRGLSLERLAERLSIKDGTLAKIERIGNGNTSLARTYVSVDEVVEIARALDVPPVALLEGIDGFDDAGMIALGERVTELVRAELVAPMICAACGALVRPIPICGNSYCMDCEIRYLCDNGHRMVTTQQQPGRKRARRKDQPRDAAATGSEVE